MAGCVEAPSSGTVHEVRPSIRSFSRERISRVSVTSLPASCPSSADWHVIPVEAGQTVLSTCSQEGFPTTASAAALRIKALSAGVSISDEEQRKKLEAEYKTSAQELMSWTVCFFLPARKQQPLASLKVKS